MATHISSEKRARQDIKRTARNTSIIGAVRTAERKVRETLAGTDKSKLASLLTDFISKTDSAVSKGVIHYKTASRKIGRLAANVAKASK